MFYFTGVASSLPLTRTLVEGVLQFSSLLLIFSLLHFYSSFFSFVFLVHFGLFISYSSSNVCGFWLSIPVHVLGPTEQTGSSWTMSVCVHGLRALTHMREAKGGVPLCG